MLAAMVAAAGPLSAGTGICIAEARDEAGDGGFAAAGGTDDSHHLPGLILNVMSRSTGTAGS